MGMTEPYDVVVALRGIAFKDEAEAVAWLSAPNADLDGASVALAMVRGRYTDAIRAIALEAGRRGIARYHAHLAEET